MSKKRFLLVSPRTFHLYQLIVRNLRYLGYDVVHIENEGYPFKYKSFGQRFYNFIRKVLFKDKTYKMKLREEYTRNKQWQTLHESGDVDIALVIRADFFEKSLIEAIRQKTTLMLGFQFDGISRDPKVLEYIDYFDRFYVFDQDDIKKYPSYKLRFSPNFYFDYPDLLKKKVSDNYYDVFYVSTYDKSRINALINLHQYLANYYKTVKFILVCKSSEKSLLPDYVIQHIEVRHTYIFFEEQLQYIARADIIVDLVIAEHNGYSFRILEGLKFGKKVITTNEKIVDATFYHPNNFFILRNDNYGELGDFLKSPYVSIEQKLIEKYSFSNWLADKLIVE